MRELAVSLRSDAVPAMVRLLGDDGACLTELTMLIGPNPYFSHRVTLLMLTHLRELCIEWDNDHVFNVAEFEQFAHLSRGLQELRLLNARPYTRLIHSELHSAVIHPEHWQKALWKMPDLTVHRAALFCQFHCAVLRIVGKQCRLIEYVRLPMPCQPWKLERTSERVLFPHLRELAVDTSTQFERLT